MITTEVKSQTTDLQQKNAENALMPRNGEVTKHSSQGFCLVIGTSMDEQMEQMDFLPEDYPECAESDNSEYDSWLG